MPDSQYSTQLLHEFGGEPGVSIADDFAGESVVFEYFCDEQLCDSFSRDFLLAGDEKRRFRAVVISDSENGVIVTRLRQFCDEIEGHHFEGLRILGRENWREHCLLRSGVDLVSLALPTSLDELDDVLFECRPPVASLH